MVKIISKTKAEKGLEDKTKNLFGITSKLVEKGEIKISLEDGYLRVKDKIYIHCYRNLIKINEEQDFDLALKLAEAYEKETEEVWKLKRMY